MSAAAVDYRRIFEHTAERLERAGISVRLEFGPSVVPGDVEQLEKACGISFPVSLRQFYSEVGSGLTFRWFANRSDPAEPFCWLVVPTLDGLRQEIEYLRMLNECLDGHNFWESEAPELARQQYQRQLSFFPILRENVDLICIEPRAGSEAVVFFDHEWSFHKRGISGIRLADSLEGFWQAWSSVGFVEPTHYWWPGTISDGKVNWSREFFGFQVR